MARASLRRFALPGLLASAPVSRHLFPERMVAASPVVGNPPAYQALERAQEMEPRATGSHRAGPWDRGGSAASVSLHFPRLPPASLRTARDTPHRLLPFLPQSIALVELTWPPGGLWCSVPGTQGPPFVSPCCLEVEGQGLRQATVPGQPRTEALSGPRQTPCLPGWTAGSLWGESPVSASAVAVRSCPWDQGGCVSLPWYWGQLAAGWAGLQSEPVGLERWGCEIVCGLPVGGGWSPAHLRAGASPATCLSSVRI